MRCSHNERSSFVAMLVAGAAALLAGCATPPAPPAGEPDPAAVRLQDLLAQKDAMNPATASADAAKADSKPEAKAKGMAGTRMTLSFAGNAPELLRPLAAARGLQFRVTGPQPHLPLFVLVDQKEAALEDVLRDVAAQFGQRASLALTDSAIEVRYRPQQ